jgi:DNA polymerase-3 subunit alpha
MEYIPNYIRRKHGKEKIEYDHPIMEEYLKTTYGITVYQEQVMQLSRAMAGFTRGQADSLRKAMGKKIEKMMAELKVMFLEGCVKNEIAEKTARKVWSDWEAFAKYAFNKSHSTCYAYLAYRMAYIKAHYPAEFYAAVLSRNLSVIKDITYYIDEARHHGIPVLGPDVNESELRFTVNRKGQIRFGLAAIKGVGESAVESIISERTANGPYSNIFDFTKRVNLRAVNKRSMESLAMAGAFDSFPGSHRAQYFYKKSGEELNFIEKLIRHMGAMQNRQASMQASLFGDAEEVRIADPVMPECEPLSKLAQLQFENEVIGFFMSGHPLDEYRTELDNFANFQLERMQQDLPKLKNKEVRIGGMVTAFSHKIAKNGNEYGTFTIEDYTGAQTFMLFKENYLKYKHLLEVGRFLYIRGTVDKSYRNDEMEVRINGIELLSEVIDKYTRNITLFLSVEDLDDKKAELIAEAMRKFPGECPVKLRVSDPKSAQVLDLKSKNYRVFPADFVRWLNEVREIPYKINMPS